MMTVFVHKFKQITLASWYANLTHHTEGSQEIEISVNCIQSYLRIHALYIRQYLLGGNKRMQIQKRFDYGTALRSNFTSVLA